MVKLSSANVVGTASQERWSQAQTISYDEHREIMVVLKLECESIDSLVDLATMGTAMIAEVEKNGKFCDDESKLHDLIGRVFEDLSEDVSVEVLVGLLLGETLMLYGKGAVAGYLARDGQLACLKNDFGAGETMVGTVAADDSVLLCTHEFVQSVGAAQLKQILIEDESPAEAFAPLMHKQSDSSGVAAVVGQIEEPQEAVPKMGWWQKIKNRQPTIHLRDETPRRLNLWVGGTILGLLILMIGVGMVRRVTQRAETEFATLNLSVSAKIDESLGASELNPELTRSLISQARGEVESYLSSDIRETYRERATKLLGVIDTTEEKAFKKNEIKLSTVVELAILADGLQADKMKSDGKGNLIFADTSAARIVAMNLTDRSRQILEIPNADRVVDMTVSDTKVYGLSQTSVLEFFWKKDESKKAIEADEFWKEPERIELFAGNVYILDKDQGEIWKYPTLGDTFGGRRRWFAVGIAPDLSNVVDMKVVGDIWLLTSTGKLERYSRGAPVNFSMDGFPSKDTGKRLSEPRAVWATESLIYVLESGAGRVVVFGDDGKYRAQYTSSEFAGASDLVVVDDNGYVLIDNTVKEFGL